MRKKLLLKCPFFGVFWRAKIEGLEGLEGLEAFFCKR